MNKAVVSAQSSPVQQMVPAGGNPSLWSINNIRPSPHHHPFLVVPPPPPPPQSHPWSDSHELPHQSWSQFVLGGLLDEEGKPGLIDTQAAKKLENWEQKVLNQTSSEFQVAKLLPTDSWSSHQTMLSASSPKSCITTTLSNNAADFSPKSSDLKHRHQDPSYECNSSSATTGGAAKKARIQPSSTQSTFKVRKEKLGDRITALHQIVSPFGKTDTASVLLEAIGYIRFLQSQIEALSRPYIGSGSAASRQQHPESDEEPTMDLRSRGLCLVPISCTPDVGGDINGADYWAPAFCANFR